MATAENIPDVAPDVPHPVPFARGGFSGRGRGFGRGRGKTTPNPRPPLEDAPPEPKKPRPGIKSKAHKPTAQLDPLIQYFSIYTGNIGLPMVCEVVFNSMKARDPKLNVTLYQLQYVTCLAYWNRLAIIGKNLGYSPMLANQFDLNYYAQGIVLPSAIVQYISTIGLVKTAVGTQIVPRIPSEVEEEWYVYPGDLWALAHDEQVGAWHLDPAWIVAYNDSITRGGKIDFGLKTVDYTNVDGGLGMLVSCRGPDVLGLNWIDQQIVAITPCQMDKVEAGFGGAVYYRDYRQYHEWPGDHVELLYGQFEGVTNTPRQVLAQLCASRTKSTK